VIIGALHKKKENSTAEMLWEHRASRTPMSLFTTLNWIFVCGPMRVERDATVCISLAVERKRSDADPAHLNFFDALCVRVSYLRV